MARKRAAPPSPKLVEALTVALELTQTHISLDAERGMLRELSAYPEDKVLAALSRAQREVSRRLTVDEILWRLEVAPPLGVSEIVEDYRAKHEAGDATAALHALRVCALHRCVMPAWLADIVDKALTEALFRSGVDEVLGIGSEKKAAILRAGLRDMRNEGIRVDYELLPKHNPSYYGVGKGDLIAELAKRYRVSVKTVELIVYPKPNAAPKD